MRPCERDGDIGADEPGAAGDENAHRSIVVRRKADRRPARREGNLDRPEIPVGCHVARDADLFHDRQLPHHGDDAFGTGRHGGCFVA